MLIKECGPGWDKLIDPLIALCTLRKVKIVQIKEKFGGLRFYVEYSNPAIDRRITEAEKQSFNICEMCGEPGELLKNNDWLKTLCALHTNKLER